MKVIRKELTAEQVSPPNLRYNPDCDCIEQTPDGGTTWIPNPDADPRTADGFRLPAAGGDDAQCNTAARLVAAWQEVLNGLFQAGNASQFATSVLGILLLLTGGAGILIDIIFLVFEALIAIGVSNIEAAFTNTVWDGIECIIYCHVSADGSISATEADGIMSDIASQYPGTVYNTLAELKVLFGDVLMSNAGVERSETGDCDSCSCRSTLCVGFDPDDPFTIISFGHGTSFADATVDDSFGNPLPSLKDGKGMSGGESGFGVAVEIDLGAAVHVLSTTLDYFYVRNDFASLYIEIQWLNESHGLVATENQTVSSSFSEWHSYVAPSVDYSSVRYVQIYAAGSSFIFTDGDCWIDNVCIEYE